MPKAPIEALSPQHGEKRREEYAKMLEDLAEQVRSKQEFPDGMFIVFAWHDGSVGDVYEFEPGFSAFKLVGILELAKLKLLDEVAGLNE